MDRELRDIQAKNGATFNTSASGIEVPMSYGNDAEALQAVREGVALCDRSHWGLLQLSGADKLRFLHNQSTNDFQNLQPGQGCETVFVTSTARTIDIVTAYVTDDSVLLLVSPNRRQKMMEWLDRYIFPADKVDLKDISDTTGIFSIIGPQSRSILAQHGFSSDEPFASHQTLTLGDADVRVAVGSGLATEGFTLIFAANQGPKLWQTLTDSGSIPLGEQCWKQLRVSQGRPASDHELTEDYNPLEAGLWHNISFEKGCYIGQETIARLNTYQGVKQQLWGLKLSAPASPGTPVTIGENKIGTLTSYADTPDGAFGLAYIRTKAGGVGLQVKVGDADAEVVDVPYLTRGYLAAK
ncbi:CAF17-like 4Fe-4S cluster assembly/insertion protein YgfZ [Phormidium sp. CCY1219]|uniref:CAF17-like 4Fe-4S cluster assembly/insertion protein YgfZ n=1 Tax=Phormidium sp. CCY1219 TaxID=2886104 RepID=UPI002D1F5CEE|nr:folate-binding protein [Phormidium sp. CCY1219]MEB3831411.1 folate-binding protein [Phormidium sp. CCY1219]